MFDNTGGTTIDFNNEFKRFYQSPKKAAIDYHNFINGNTDGWVDTDDTLEIYSDGKYPHGEYKTICGSEIPILVNSYSRDDFGFNEHYFIQHLRRLTFDS